MDKKNLKLVLILIGVAVLLAGGYYGWQKYRQAQFVKNYLKQIGLPAEYYKEVMKNGGGAISEEALKAILEKGGGNLAGLSGLVGGGTIGGLVGGGAGGGTVPEEEEAEQTPEQIFAETPEVGIGNDAFVKEVDQTVRPILTNIFGGAKITTSFSNYFGADAPALAYKLKRLTTASDAASLMEKLTAIGFSVEMSSAASDGAYVIVKKGNDTYTFNYNTGEQELILIAQREEASE